MQAASGMNLLESSVPARDLSNELRSYPQDLLQSPPAISTAAFRFAPAGVGQASGTPLIESAYVQSSQSLQGRTNDPFAELIAIPEIGFGRDRIGIGWRVRVGSAARLLARPRQNDRGRLSRRLARDSQACLVPGPDDDHYAHRRRLHVGRDHFACLALYCARPAVSMARNHIRSAADRAGAVIVHWALAPCPCTG